MTESTAKELVGRISTDMWQAMKDRDTLKVGVLKSLMAEFSTAEAVAPPAMQTDATNQDIAGAREGVGSTEAARKQLTHGDVTTVIQAEIAELQQAHTLAAGQAAYQAETAQKIAILKQYL